jgi:hypothetical protein
MQCYGYGRMLSKIYTLPILVINVVSSLLHSVIVFHHHRKNLTLESKSFDAKFISIAI